MNRSSRADTETASERLCLSTAALYRGAAKEYLNTESFRQNPTINRPQKGDKIMSFTSFLSGARGFLCVAVFIITARHLQGQPPAEARKPVPSPAELTELATIIKPSAEANKWQQIPWLTDLNEARRLAAEEKRPLFLWTVLGEPLDEC